MHQTPQILVHAIPYFVILILAEVIYAVRTQRELYEVKDASTSIALGIGNLLVGLVSKTLILGVFVFIYQFRLFSIPFGAWWAWVLCFFVDDFSYYWFHRTSHEVRWFWASHVVHHSSERYNLAAALRQTWTGDITGAFIFWTWMPLVGFEPAMVLAMQAFSLLYQFWIHTETIGKMPGWYEAILNTPSHHRVHHGSDIDYLDKNHAGTLIVWDRLFGTFEAEVRRPTYGLTQNVQTFNPVKVAFHEWVRMARDLGRARTWRQAWMFVFGAPGWSPDGRTKTTRAMRRERAATGITELKRVPH